MLSVENIRLGNAVTEPGAVATGSNAQLKKKEGFADPRS